MNKQEMLNELQFLYQKLLENQNHAKAFEVLQSICSLQSQDENAMVGIIADKNILLG